MQWLNWTKRLVPRLRSRRDRRSDRPQHLSPFLPRIYRLEDRRVLDVSAAFSAATAHLDVLLANSAETATISVVSGNLTVTDSQSRTASDLTFVTVETSAEGGCRDMRSAGVSKALQEEFLPIC